MKVKDLFFAACLTAVLILTGCQASLHSVTVVPRPAISPLLVKCYDSMPTNAIIIGQLHIQNISGFSHYFLHPEKDQMINQAAAMGANGLVFYPPTTQIFVGYQDDATAIYIPEK